MARPSWNEYFMSLAHLAASRSTCSRASVGTILVQDKDVVATGYNGALRGKPHCDEVGHMLLNDSCVRAVHAEENALNSAARRGISTNESTAYITHFPCWRCFRSLAQAGVGHIVYDTFKVNGMNTEIYNEIMNSTKPTIEMFGLPSADNYSLIDGAIISPRK